MTKEKKKMGRPPGIKWPLETTTYLDAESRARLQVVADSQDVSVAEYIRRLIWANLAEV